MAGSLLGIIEEYLSADVMQRVSTFLGESPANTGKTVQCAVPAILGALIQRAQTQDGADAVLGLIGRAARNTPGADPARLLDSPASLHQAVVTGAPLLTSILGGKQSAVTELLASSCGSAPSAVSTLLALLTPLLLSLVGRESLTRGGGPSGLMSLLSIQKAEVMSFVPSGLTGLVHGLGALNIDADGDRTMVGGTPQVSVAEATREIGARLGTALNDVPPASASFSAAVPRGESQPAGDPSRRARPAPIQPAAPPIADSDRLEELATSRSSRSWLLPAIVIALLALGAWYFLRAERQSAIGIPGGSASAATGSPSSAPDAAPPTPSAATSTDVATSKTTTVPKAAAPANAHAATAVGNKAAKTGSSPRVAAAAGGSEKAQAASHGEEDAPQPSPASSAGVAPAATPTPDASTDTARAVAAERTESAESAESKEGKESKGSKESAEDAEGVNAVADPASAPPSTATLTLPDGKQLRLPTRTANYQLAEYLSAPGASGQTFVFEHLRFRAGTTQLTSDSRRTLRNLAAILKAWPSTEVRLDGHTDDRGEPDANQQLSQARAEAVRQLLGQRGVSVTRVATAGHGEASPIASNDTAAGRQQNRRIELVVTRR